MLSGKQKSQIITIIIPAYNEEQRIGATLEKYLSYYTQQYQDNYEILVVLNGCKDKTEEIVASYHKSHSNLKYLVFNEAIGKGGAIKEGLKVAKGELVGFTDADSSTRPEILHRLFAILELVPSVDCVVGSRRMAGSIVTGKTFKREVLSWGFNSLVNLLFNLGIKDTQCGAKVIRKHLIPSILPNLSVSNMAFDVNFLVDTKRLKAKILEIPIEWEDDERSTIKSPFKTSTAMAFSIIRLKIMYSPLKVIYPILEPIGRFLLKILVGE